VLRTLQNQKEKKHNRNLFWLLVFWIYINIPY
jgi:hypothetical protein